MKKYLLFACLCMLALTGCTKDQESVSESSSAASVESVSVISIDQEDVNKIQSALEDGYSNYYDISYSNETSTFHLTAKEGLSETETLKKVASNPNYEEHETTIKEMAGSLVEMSNIIQENIVEGINIELDNPNENGEPLFIVSDGQIEYPILK